MRTRLSAACEAVIETGWLLALLLVPLFFNVYSQRVFEPDKIGLIRTIATLMAAVWVVLLIERLSIREARRAFTLRGVWDRLRGTPLMLPTFLLVGAYLISTAVSVTPRVSFWGSYERLQGTYSLLSYVVLGLSVLFLLRTRQQLERLLLVVVLTSVPVSLYGIVQHYGLDPLPWGGDVTERVSGNLGNAIFIAAYLIMVVPVTLAEWLRYWRQETTEWHTKRRLGVALILGALALGQGLMWGLVGLAAGLWFSALVWGIAGIVGRHTGGTVRRWVMLGLYQTVLAMQLVCIVFTQSRGPWLGLLAGLFLLLIVVLVARRQHRVALGLGAAAVFVTGLLGLMNLPTGPLASVRDMPYVGRLGRVFEVQSGTGRVRVLIWQGALEMITGDPLRAMVGHGPESMYVAFPPYYSPELAHLERRTASPDRSHNETYDALLMTGVIGFAAYMYLFYSIYWTGMRSMGLAEEKRDRWLFSGFALGGGGVGAVLPYLAEGQWRYAGITMPLAMAAGVGLYAVAKAVADWRSTKTSDASAGSGVWSERSILVAGLLGAILAHFVEIHFGIAIGATRTYFWLMAALLVVVGEGWVAWDEPAVVLADEAQSSRRRRTRGRQSKPLTAAGWSLWHGATLGAFGAGILGTLVWDYAANATGRSSVLTVLWESLTTMQAQGRPDVRSWGLVAVVGFTWVVLGLLAAGMETPELSTLGWRQRARSGLIAAGVAAGGAGLYALFHAARLRPPVDLLPLFSTYLLFLVAVWGVGVTAIAAVADRTMVTEGGMGLLGAVVLLAALPLVNRYNLNPIRADMVFKQGMRFEQEGSLPAALNQYGQASTLAPQEDRYLLFQGRVALEQARLEADMTSRQRYLSSAQEALLAARSLNPLNTDHTANLARLHRVWGELEASEAARQAHWERAAAYYAEAHALSPKSAQLLNEWGLTLLLLGDSETGWQRFQDSLALDGAFPQTHVLIGDYHSRQGAWDEAVAAYREAVALDGSLVQVWSSLGYAASQKGDWQTALEANLAVYRRMPTDYNTVKNLAIIYAQLGETDEALEYAEGALDLAPVTDRPALEQFVQELTDNP